MKPVLGKHLVGKKVVSNSGLELGYVVDAGFELGGQLVGLIVKPDMITKELEEEVDDHGMLSIGFSDVKAIGRYVVVNFPSSGR